MILDFNDHATKCGINMTGKVALPIEESAGRLVMINVIDPVTRDTVINAGTTMDCQLIDICESYGVDYVIVYRGSHTIPSVS